MFADPEKLGKVDQLIKKEEKAQQELNASTRSLRPRKPATNQFPEDEPYVPTPSSIGK